MWRWERHNLRRAYLLVKWYKDQAEFLSDIRETQTANNRSHKSLLPSRDSPGYQIYHVWCFWQEIKTIQRVSGEGVFYICEQGPHTVLSGKTAACVYQGLICAPLPCPHTSYLIPSPNNLLQTGTTMIPIWQIRKLRPGRTRTQTQVMGRQQQELNPPTSSCTWSLSNAEVLPRKPQWQGVRFQLCY